MRFGLEYDSSDTAATLSGAYKAHPQAIRGQGSGVWRAAAFRVTDARFAGSQNGRADFRLFFTGGPLKVRAVSVRRVNAQ